MATTANDKDRIKEATPLSINKKIENDTWQRVASYIGKSESRNISTNT